MLNKLLTTNFEPSTVDKLPTSISRDLVVTSLLTKSENNFRQDRGRRTTEFRQTSLLRTYLYLSLPAGPFRPQHFPNRKRSLSTHLYPFPAQTLCAVQACSRPHPTRST